MKQASTSKTTLDTNLTSTSLEMTALSSSTNQLPGFSKPNKKRISPAVEMIVKLSNAGMKDGIILGFATNSGWSTKLTGDDLIYLKNEGVSDSVLTALLRLAHSK